MKLKTSDIRRIGKNQEFIRAKLAGLKPNECLDVTKLVKNAASMYAAMHRLRQKGIIPKDSVMIRTKQGLFIGRK